MARVVTGMAPQDGKEEEEGGMRVVLALELVLPLPQYPLFREREPNAEMGKSLMPTQDWGRRKAAERLLSVVATEGATIAVMMEVMICYPQCFCAFFCGLLQSWRIGSLSDGLGGIWFCAALISCQRPLLCRTTKMGHDRQSCVHKEAVGEVVFRQIGLRMGRV